ncbi:MAG: imelysin family protein [Roseovarius sp.]
MTRLNALALTAALAATPALAGIDEALDDHILPRLAQFAEASATLAETARDDCLPQAVRPAYQAAFDAWMPIADLRIGPSETGALSIGFWPDPRGFTQRTLTGLVADQDTVADDPTGYADVSIAARGVFALDMLLYDPAFSEYASGSYTCRLVATIAADLDMQAAELQAAWTDSFVATLRTAGAEGNTTYLTDAEAQRAIFTQILSSLEFTSGKRLGLPMGSFDRPRPALAEARRSDRSLDNVLLSVDGAVALARALADHDLPRTEAALADVRDAAARIEDPTFKDVETPQGRLHVEVLQQTVDALHDTIAAELGEPLGISAGFNAQDGD